MTNHVLKHESKILQGIISKLDELQRLNQLLSQHEPEIAKHCQVVKVEKKCLFIIVDSGNWTTQLRFRIPDLMTHLRQYKELENLSGIICKTRPNHTLIKSPTPHARKVSGITPNTAANILETAKTIQDTKLRAILERIAKNLITS